MEPITIVSYVLTSFFGYYIGADLYNHYRYQQNFHTTISKLNDISIKLNRIEHKIIN